MTKKVIAVANDVEYTTFLDKIGGDVLAIGLVEVMEDFTLGRRLMELSRATSAKYFNDESQEVHKFTYWNAIKFQKRRECCNKIMEWFKPLPEGLPFLHYSNAKSDWKWMEAHFLKENLHPYLYKYFPEDMTESVLQMARKNLKHIVPSKKINPITGKLFTKYSLQNVCDHYGIAINNHEVMSDTLACAEVWCNIMQGKNTWTGLLL